ncbi:MAG: RNA polymerase sigma factor [Oscillospiraceae bacterium]|nr:RNA polymerase sigma factor [Oscillospiraceae bacterium]
MDNGASSYRRFLNGDDKGIVEIIRDYKDGLTLYLNGYVNNIFVAEELMEETFFKLVTKRPKFTGKYSFKTWLYTIGRNTAIDYIRHNGKISDSPIEDFENYLFEEESVEKSYLREERKITVHRALRQLKAEYRQILYLIYFEGFNNSEAAAVMKKSKHQIENLVYRAKMSLKSELDKEGFIYEEL